MNPHKTIPLPPYGMTHDPDWIFVEYRQHGAVLRRRYLYNLQTGESLSLSGCPCCEFFSTADRFLADHSGRVGRAYFWICAVAVLALLIIRWGSS